LPTLVDFPLEVTFFIEQVLETKMGLVHVMTCICSCLLACSCCSIGVSVECFETGYESIGTNLNGCWVDEGLVRGYELLKVLDGWVFHVVVVVVVGRHVGADRFNAVIDIVAGCDDLELIDLKIPATISNQPSPLIASADEALVM